MSNNFNFNKANSRRSRLLNPGYSRFSSMNNPKPNKNIKKNQNVKDIMKNAPKSMKQIQLLYTEFIKQNDDLDFNKTDEIIKIILDEGVSDIEINYINKLIKQISNFNKTNARMKKFVIKGYDFLEYIIDKGVYTEIMIQDNYKLYFEDIVLNNTQRSLDIMLIIKNIGINVNYLIDEYQKTTILLKLLCAKMDYKLLNNKVKFLLDCGADPNHEDMRGQTAIMYALKYQTKYADLINLLLCYAADINYQDSNGITPLMHVISNKMDILQLNKIKMLLELNADPNIQNNLEENALLHAIRHSCRGKTYNIANLLMDYGASPWEKNKLGDDALMASVRKLF